MHLHIFSHAKSFLSPLRFFKPLQTFDISELWLMFCQHDGQESFGNLNLKEVQGGYCPLTMQYEGLGS